MIYHKIEIHFHLNISRQLFGVSSSKVSTYHLFFILIIPWIHAQCVLIQWSQMANIPNDDHKKINSVEWNSKEPWKSNNSLELWNNAFKRIDIIGSYNLWGYILLCLVYNNKMRKKHNLSVLLTALSLSASHGQFRPRFFLIGRYKLYLLGLVLFFKFRS